MISKEEFLRKFDLLPQKTEAFELKKQFLILLKNKKLQNPEVNNQYVVTMIQSINQDNSLQNFEDLKEFLENPENQLNSLKILDQLKIYKEKISRMIQEIQDRKKHNQMKAFFLIIQSLLYKRIYYETINDPNVDSEKYVLDGMNLLYEQDYELTELYCADQTIYSEGNQHEVQSKSSLFLLNKLIEKYVENNQRNKILDLKNRINQLLIKYSNNKNLDIGQLINILENEYLVNDINFLDFLEKSIVELDQEEKTLQLQKSITEAEMNKINAEYEQYRKRWVILDENTRCAKCQETIRTLLFKVYPNGVIVDCACGNKNENKNVCPITFQNFEKTSYV